MQDTAPRGGEEPEVEDADSSKCQVFCVFWLRTLQPCLNLHQIHANV